MAYDHLSSPPRLHCSYRIATIVVCTFNVVATLFLLRSFIHPLFLKPSTLTAQLHGNANSLKAFKYTDAQMKRMKESIITWRSLKPVELVKRVKEIQEESIASYASKPLEVTQAGAGSDLAQRLKEIHDVKKSDQEALEEWRRKKLEEAKRRSKEKISQEEEYIS